MYIGLYNLKFVDGTNKLCTYQPCRIQISYQSFSEESYYFVQSTSMLKGRGKMLKFAENFSVKT